MTMARQRDRHTTGKLPPGLYWRGASLWIRYRVGGKEQREPVPNDDKGRQLSPRAAAQLRAERITQLGRGEVVADSRRLTIGKLLDVVLLDYEMNQRGSIKTAESRLRILRDAVGPRTAVNFSTEDVQHLQARWLREGLTPATINRRCNLLRKAFRLSWRSGRLPRVLYVPRLDEHSARAVYIGETNAKEIAAHLPVYAVDPFRFSLLYGIRKGQLAATERRFVDLKRGLIEWPAAVCKARVPHTLPLDDEGLAIVERAMAAAVPWCPFLFHGRDCKPGRTRTRSARYGCLGNLRGAFQNACAAAGLVVGRKHGGLVWHCTRNTAATDLVASGCCTIEDVMKIGGWKTADVARRYDLGNLDALRERIARARAARSVVVPLTGRRTAKA
jgi:integrase